MLHDRTIFEFQLVQDKCRNLLGTMLTSEDVSIHLSEICSRALRLVCLYMLLRSVMTRFLVPGMLPLRMMKSFLISP